MFPRLNLKPEIGLLLLLTFTSSALAHQVDVADEVGGTLHIKPNDIPRAGEDSLAWFALIQKGGDVIPLTACDCNLAVYAKPFEAGDPPIAQPELTAVSAEGYEDIPGAEILFPGVGAYELVLSGKPAATRDFTPFDLRFEVTVALGQTQIPASSEPPPSSSSSPLSQPNTEDTVAFEPETGASNETEASNHGQAPPILWRKPAVMVLAITAIGILWGVIQRVMEKSKENSNK